ncbi:MAG: helix-turn-helix domain-containing protein [Deltaproteobacteria bacterium]|nr:helix-turn-helix domain-containing protein [Deltaproteobacteria bacterium]
MSELLTIRETCEKLRISRASLYRLVGRGELHLVKIGGRSLVREEEVRLLIKKSARRPAVAPRAPLRKALEDYWQELVRSGLVGEESRQAFFNPKGSRFNPVEVKGTPLSELIIAERGER